MLHVMVGLPLLVMACLLQLIPLDFYKGYEHKFWKKLLSQETMHAYPIYCREVIRFIFVLIGGTQLWAGIRDW